MIVNIHTREIALLNETKQFHLNPLEPFTTEYLSMIHPDTPPGA